MCKNRDHTEELSSFIRSKQKHNIRSQMCDRKRVIRRRRGGHGGDTPVERGGAALRARRQPGSGQQRHEQGGERPRAAVAGAARLCVIRAWDACSHGHMYHLPKRSLTCSQFLRCPLHMMSSQDAHADCAQYARRKQCCFAKCQAEQYVFAGLESRSLDPAKGLLRRSSQPMARPSANAFDVVSSAWSSSVYAWQVVSAGRAHFLAPTFGSSATSCLPCLSLL